MNSKYLPEYEDTDAECRNPRDLNRSARTPKQRENQPHTQSNPSLIFNFSALQTEISKSNGDLKIASLPPIEDLPEEVTELAEREEQAVAEIRRQRGQVRYRYHFRPLFGFQALQQWLDLEEKVREIFGIPKIREKERETARFTARREDWTKQSNPLLRF